jgi:hypothetical protein
MTDWMNTPTSLRNLTREVLGDVIEDGPEPDLARAEGAGGRFRLDADRWRTREAEVRLVRIEGASTAIFNCLVFPNRDGAAPVFVAELLVVGGAPKLMFVDLQHAGLGAAGRGRVAGRTAPLATAYAAWQSEEPAPAWATEFSAGGAVYARPASSTETLPVTDIYCDFLRAWCDLARAEPTGTLAAAEVAQFKAHHVEQSPVAGYLARVFGEAWAGRFLTQFLYR